MSSVKFCFFLFLVVLATFLTTSHGHQYSHSNPNAGKYNNQKELHRVHHLRQRHTPHVVSAHNAGLIDEDLLTTTARFITAQLQVAPTTDQHYETHDNNTFQSLAAVDDVATSTTQTTTTSPPPAPDTIYDDAQTMLMAARQQDQFLFVWTTFAIFLVFCLLGVEILRAEGNDSLEKVLTNAMASHRRDTTDHHIPIESFGRDRDDDDDDDDNNNDITLSAHLLDTSGSDRPSGPIGGHRGGKPQHGVDYQHLTADSELDTDFELMLQDNNIFQQQNIVGSIIK